MEFSHIPVLLNETIEGLAIKENGIYADATAGGGGHSSEILKRLKSGKLISIDRDPDAISTLTEKFKNNENSIIIKGRFSQIKELLTLRGVGRLDGVMFDIGVSSHQLDTAERGFSYHGDAPLDMRMSQSGRTAGELVNTLSFAELRKLISEYGEEKYASSIASGIVKSREKKGSKPLLSLRRSSKRTFRSESEETVTLREKPFRLLGSQSTTSWASCKEDLTARLKCSVRAAEWRSSPFIRLRTGS